MRPHAARIRRDPVRQTWVGLCSSCSWLSTGHKTMSSARTAADRHEQKAARRAS